MWRKWNELTIKQRAQVDTMFSADVYLYQSADGLLNHRQRFGYWLADDGNVTCRRYGTKIHNWQATSYLEA